MASKYEVEDPRDYFSQWEYAIVPAHWNTLGVVPTVIVDTVKTKILRNRLRDEGLSHKEAMKRAIHRSSFINRAALARDNEGRVSKTTGKPFEMPPQRGYAFAEGYAFVSVRDGGGIQVLDVVGDMVDVCEREPGMGRFRQPYRMPVEELVEWLRTGRPPEHRRVSLYKLRSELMQTEIRRDNGGP